VLVVDDFTALVAVELWLVADVGLEFDLGLELGVGLVLDGELELEVEDVAKAGTEIEADFQSDAELVWDLVAVIELSTWLTERPSQRWLSRKSCSTFSLPIVSVTLWMTVPF